MRNTIFLLATLFALIGLAGRATHAEPPSVSYIFPAGAQRGTSVQARVGGHYMYERARFQLSGPGVTAPTEIARTETIWFEGPLVRLPASQRSEDYPKDYLAPLTIAADAPTGPRTWQVWNSQGATPARKFIVGDLPEVVEHEMDAEPLNALEQVQHALLVREQDVLGHFQLDELRGDAGDGKNICDRIGEVACL